MRQAAAERATIALLTAQRPGPSATPTDPGQWIYRKLAASAGTREIWARVDDTRQASYVHGALVTCGRAAGCAGGAPWLMPAGPAYRVVYPSGAAASTLELPADPRPLLDKLNTYLFNARTYQFAGYAESGAVTLLLQQATVSGPGVRP